MTNEQKQIIVDKVRQFAGQKVGIMTVWDNMECALRRCAVSDGIQDEIAPCARKTGKTLFRRHRNPLVCQLAEGTTVSD